MSKIQWTEESWNPIIGCSKVSPGCDNCYAEKMANRLVGMWQDNYTNVISSGKWNGKTYLAKSQLAKPGQRKKPTIYFVCSMGDLFHKSVPFEWISKVFAVTQKYLQHTFLILTKRPERMKQYFEHTGIRFPYLNVWLGVTAENQESADWRINILLHIPAAKRFVSIEPMLEAVNISKHLRVVNESGFSDYGGPFAGRDKLDWVICGEESGPGRRGIRLCWVDDLLDQCLKSGTSFFLKQLYQNNKKVSMPEFKGQVWNQRPE